jgi:predicted metal-dependent HD superfamily phosphohydrolase
VRSSYSSPKRKYHRLSHISFILQSLDKYGTQLLMPIPVRFAAIYHDVRDSEAESAHVAQQALAELGLPVEWGAVVRDLIMCTKDHKPLPGILAHDSAILADCDLLILSSKPEAYDAYTRQVRLEYPQYNDEEFRKGRHAVMVKFFKRDPVYHTAAIRARFEQQARANLEREIATLEREIAVAESKAPQQ